MNRTVAQLLGLSLVVTVLLVLAVLYSPSDAIAVIYAVGDDPVAFAIVLTLLYVIRPVFAWPTTPLAIVVGWGYGLAMGVPVALLGICVTVLPVFFVFRRLTPDSIESAEATPVEAFLYRGGERIERIYARTGPFRGVVVSRLLPIHSDIATATASASNVRTHHFLIGTIVGELPWTIAAVFVGASAATLTMDGLGSVGLPVAIGAALLAVALLARPVYAVIADRHNVS